MSVSARPIHVDTLLSITDADAHNASLVDDSTDTATGTAAVLRGDEVMSCQSVQLYSDVEWTYNVSVSAVHQSSPSINTVHRQLNVNNESVMSLIYRTNEQGHVEETVFNWRADRLLVIVYNHQQLPRSFTPAHTQALAAVHVDYDVTGHVTWWQRGDVIMTYVYESVTGQLTEWTQTDQRQRLVHRYVYDQNSGVVSTATGLSVYKYQYKCCSCLALHCTRVT